MFPVYFITWTTYGTWLPGDDRGWVDGSVTHGENRLKLADPAREERARLRMRDQPVVLSREQRGIVDMTIREAAQFRGWHVMGLSVRSNHVHLIVHCANATPEETMSRLKARCSRQLNEQCRSTGSKIPIKWWTRHGSTRYLNDEKSIQAAVEYVVQSQDRKTSRGGVRGQN